jgi:hypothetical protein
MREGSTGETMAELCFEGWLVTSRVGCKGGSKVAFQGHRACFGNCRLGLDDWTVGSQVSVGDEAEELKQCLVITGVITTRQGEVGKVKPEMRSDWHLRNTNVEHEFCDVVRAVHCSLSVIQYPEHEYLYRIWIRVTEDPRGNCCKVPGVRQWASN